MNYEDKVVKYWEKNKTQEKALKLNHGKKKYYFLDGPPYATGHIHMGTALNKVLKDYYLRYFRMKGLDVTCQPGYDCHGLPIENKVERKLGLKNKDDIEKIGVAKFIKECKAFAEKNAGIMTKEFADLGVWMDWDSPYMTMDESYIEGAWYTFKRAYEKGLLYKGLYSVHVCPHCETVVAYNEIEYEKMTDTSVYVKLKLKNKDEHLLIWTTTPWTLPSNTGVMAHPKFEYCLVETEAGKLWIAKEVLEGLMEKLEIKYKVLKTTKGKEMDGWEYESAMDLPLQKDVSPRIVMSDRFVNLEKGTGLVHCAPGHGVEDFQVGQANKLKILSPLNMNGTFKKEAGKYAGMFAKDADAVIMSDLKTQGKLIYKEPIEHDYPLCWRCRSPLLFIAVPQWFFKISEIQHDMIAENKKVNWVPAWGGKRFDNWLETLGDWPISRQRYWGIPLPIWVCGKCKKVKVVGSKKELGVKVASLHKPKIDKVKLKCECGASMGRVPDILDVWFDAGVAPWASLGYPNEKKLFNRLWPVDFVLEGADQTRGWWNSLNICSYITFDRRAYENVLQHGLVLAEGGVKMSKSRGNIVQPQDVVKKYNRDLCRHYLLRWDPSLDFDFSWEKAEALNRFSTLLENLFTFFELYCKKKPLKGLEPEDKWIVSRANTIAKQVGEYNSSFQGFKAVQLLEDFVCNDVSRWYVKLVRGRTWPLYKGKDKDAAFAALYYTLDIVNKLLAPAIPYKAEWFNTRVFNYDSVHFKAFPEPDENLIDKQIEADMDYVRTVVEAALNARQKAGLKKRWPVARIGVSGNQEMEEACKRLKKVVLKACNAKELVLEEFEGQRVEVGDGVVVVDTEFTDGLKAEALAAEVARAVQMQRKAMGMNVSNKVKVTVHCAELKKQLARAGALVKAKVNAVEFAVKQNKGKGVVKFMKKEIRIEVRKA